VFKARPAFRATKVFLAQLVLLLPAQLVLKVFKVFRAYKDLQAFKAFKVFRVSKENLALQDPQAQLVLIRLLLVLQAPLVH
jgi:hypothetical protein